MAKGGGYERELCYTLSRWWMESPKKLVFWRTSNSGGGATIRHRKGISNKAHAGDITAIEPEAVPFTRFITVEAKRGYGGKGKKKAAGTLQDMLDRTSKPNGLYASWVEQAMKANERAGGTHWMLIHRRDNAAAMVYFPSYLYAQLAVTCGCFHQTPVPFVAVTTKMRVGKTQQTISFVGMELDAFLGHVDPEHIRTLLGEK